MSAARRTANPQTTVAPLRSTARSHVGLVRRINEDRVFDWAGGGVWAVVDGMGGHRGGDVAAQSVIDALRLLQTAGRDPTPDAVVAALDHANAAIIARNTAHGEQAGATVVALALCDATLHLAWAGDSRCYRIRERQVDQLTRDHSVVQELIDARLLTPDVAARHPQANVVTRALGVEPDCALDRRSIEIAAGDRFLLCSDGLSRSLSDADLVGDDLDLLADRLVATALQRDGSDNISLILIDVG